MQTFLPYEDFTKAAWALDPTRLGNQRNEALIIARSLVTGEGWPNHAATRMWSRNLGALFVYARTVCKVWSQRNPGTPDTVDAQVVALAAESGMVPGTGQVVKMPLWLGDERLHAYHRSSLLAKDREGRVQPAGWYKTQGWKIGDLPAWYPVWAGYEWDRSPVELPYALGLAEG